MFSPGADESFMEIAEQMNRRKGRKTAETADEPREQTVVQTRRYSKKTMAAE